MILMVSSSAISALAAVLCCMENAVKWRLSTVLVPKSWFSPALKSTPSKAGGVFLAAGGFGVGIKIDGDDFAFADGQPSAVAQVFACIKLGLCGLGEQASNMVLKLPLPWASSARGLPRGISGSGC